jgi:hypothetical protein
MGAKIGLDIHSPLITLCGKRSAISVAIAYAKQQKSEQKEGGEGEFCLPFSYPHCVVLFFKFRM